MGLRILRGVRGTLWIALLGFGWVSLFGGLILGIFGFVYAPRIEASSACAPSESGQCFVEHEGVVTSSDGTDVRVRYDDGRRTADVNLLADSGPPVGTRVRLQRWDGDVVAVYDPGFERRYRTMFWPRRFDPYAIGFVLFGGVIVACQFARNFVRQRRATGRGTRVPPPRVSLPGGRA